MPVTRVNPSLALDTRTSAASSPFVSGASVGSSFAMGPGATVPNTSISGSTPGSMPATSTSFNTVMQQQQAANAAAQQQAGGVPVSSGTDATMASFSAELQQQQAANMQYLALQNQMQQENQTFSTLSNVLKVRSDTAKNSISNIH